MQEGENIVQYCARVKEVVNAIRGATSKIEDESVISKVLRTLMSIYVIRVSAIQDLLISSNLRMLNLLSKINYH